MNKTIISINCQYIIKCYSNSIFGSHRKYNDIHRDRKGWGRRGQSPTPLIALKTMYIITS